MGAGMAHHLVSRALQVTQQHYNTFNGRVEDGEEKTYQLQTWAAILILATFVLYLAMLSMVSHLATMSTANILQC